MNNRIPFASRMAHGCRKTMVASGLALIVIPAGCTTGSLSTEYYDVSGATVEQVFQQVSRHGPDNGKAIGQTKVAMGMSVWTVENSRECRVADARIELDLKVVLPKWSELNETDANARSQLKYLSKIVERHEHRHVEIARRYARQIERELKQMPPQPDCQRLAKEAKGVFRNGLAEHNRAQKRFDELDA